MHSLIGLVTTLGQPMEVLKTHVSMLQTDSDFAN